MWHSVYGLYLLYNKKTDKNINLSSSTSWGNKNHFEGTKSQYFTHKLLQIVSNNGFKVTFQNFQKVQTKSKEYKIITWKQKIVKFCALKEKMEILGIYLEPPETWRQFKILLIFCRTATRCLHLFFLEICYQGGRSTQNVWNYC